MYKFKFSNICNLITKKNIGEYVVSWAVFQFLVFFFIFDFSWCSLLILFIRPKKWNVQNLSEIDEPRVAPSWRIILLGVISRHTGTPVEDEMTYSKSVNVFFLLLKEWQIKKIFYLVKSLINFWKRIAIIDRHVTKKNF